jgi:hypothetical protein
MDISKTTQKSIQSIEPTSISTSDNSININNVNTNINQSTKIINMYLNGIDISSENIDLEILQKNPEFTKLKDKDKKELIKIIKSIDDDTSTAYMICKNCSYSERIIKRTMILNKMSNNTENNNSVDQTKYKFMKYLDILPHTRDYICKNKSCATHQDYKLKDAKWFRPIKDSYKLYYVCCVCDTIWNNT